MAVQAGITKVGHVCVDGGELSIQSPCQLLAAISQVELTGSLTFRKNDSIKELYFQAGHVVGSRSNQLSDSLGRLLFSWGQISADTHDRLLEKADTSFRMREGERLLSWGVIDAFTLKNAISRQILIRIGEVSSWHEGCYIFVPGQVKDMSNRLPLVDVLRASADGTFGENFLAAQASTLLDIVPQRLFTSAFLPLVNRIPELGLLLSRITGAIRFRGLLDFNNAKRSWMRVLLLQHLGCIDFPFADNQPPVKRLSIVPDLQNSVREAAERATAEEDVILLGCNEDLKSEADAEYASGKSALGERRYAIAETHFRKALTLAPEREDILCRLAWSRILQGPGNPELIESNLPLLEQAVRAAPQNADIHFFYGFALHMLERDAVALCELERALLINPSMKEAASLISLLKSPPPRDKYK